MLPSTQERTDHFKTLGLRETADDDRLVKRAYRQKAMIHHSDRGGDNDEMVRVNAAYEALRNQAGRMAHRAYLARIRGQVEQTAYTAPRASRPRTTTWQYVTIRHDTPPSSTEKPQRKFGMVALVWTCLRAAGWGLVMALTWGLLTAFFVMLVMCLTVGLVFDVPTQTVSAIACCLGAAAALLGFMCGISMVLEDAANSR